MNRPLETAHRIAAIQCTREQLILRANEHPWFVGVNRPCVIDCATHEPMNCGVNLWLFPLEVCKVGLQPLHGLSWSRDLAQRQIPPLRKRGRKGGRRLPRQCKCGREPS